MGDPIPTTGMKAWHSVYSVTEGVSILLYLDWGTSITSVWTGETFFSPSIWTGESLVPDFWTFVSVFGLVNLEREEDQGM